MTSALSHAAAVSVPSHVAIIMDGNGRWARRRGLPRTAGHKRGADAVRAVIEGAVELGIDYLTLYGFSNENWKRPASEISDLMGLLRLYLRRELDALRKEGIRLRFIGERMRLPADIATLMEAAELATRGNMRLTLVVALSYGSRQEIVAAARALAEDVAAGRLDPAEIDEDLFAARLETADIPDPDLLVRTSGEKRISNFLLWQCAYAELVFTETLWPDFSKDDLAAAVREYQGRERRYGAAVG